MPTPTASLPGIGCVRFAGSQFDPPGDDREVLNEEWVRISNQCAQAKAIGNWRIKDEGSIHTYRFPAGLQISGGKSLTLHTGCGTNTTRHRYWCFAGAIWNNAPPENAYLRTDGGALRSTWTEY